MVSILENANWQPCIPTDFETIWQIIKLCYFFIRQVPSVKLEVGLDSVLVHTLWDNAPSLLNSPGQQDLLRRFPLFFRQGEEVLILVERRVRTPKAGISSAVNPFGGVVCYELGRGVVRVNLDLVHSWNNLFWSDSKFEGECSTYLGRRIIQQFLQILGSKVGDADVSNLSSSD